MQSTVAYNLSYDTAIKNNFQGGIFMNFKSYLQNDVLKFWLNNSIDTKNGGIFTSLDQKGEIYGREKSVWFQGRALWIFSKVYNTIEKKEEYLNAAKTIASFIPKCTDTDGRMYFTVTEDGREIQKRRYYFSETFAAIGLAEFYKATGDINAWNMAEKYFDTAYEIFNNPSLTTPKFNPINAPYKALSPIMILLNTAQCMAGTRLNSEKYNKITEDCVTEILNGGYIKEDMGAVLEQIAIDGSFVNTPQTRVVNPGHSLECAWFLLSTGNDEAIAKAKKIIDFTMPLGLDKNHGGIIAFTDVLGMPPVALEWDMKLWWPQCEAIIANKMAYDIFKEDKYLENYNMLIDYAFNNFADKENGEWYGYLHYDNTPSTTLKGNIFKGPFHLPRMLIMLHEFNNK